MTRILVLSNMYPPHHLGGYELSCRDVMNRLRARGHDITVLTTTLRLPDVDNEPREEQTQGVRRELSFYWDDHRIVTPPIWRRLAMERGNQTALRKAVAETRPEVVSAWNMGAMSLGLLTSVIEAKLPLVLSICDEWPVYGPRVDAWTRLFLGRPRLGSAVRRFTGLPATLADLGRHAAFLYISDAIRRKVEGTSPWQPGVASVVYNGIDPDDFPPAPPGERPWRWRLLYTGRIDERKGIHVAVEALARLPARATLDVDGRGDPAYIARLRDLARRLGVDARVRFATSPRRTLKNRYRDADVVVFPTLWDEPFGLVPVEAMACRTPVVATGTGGSGEFLMDHMNCLLVPPGDAAALATAVERLAADTPLRNGLLESGSRTAAELTVDRFADVMEAWHTAAAAGFPSGLPARRHLAIV